MRAITVFPISVIVLHLTTKTFILAFQHCTYHNQMCLDLSSPIYNMFNTKLNVLIKIICFRKSEVSVERISVCNVIENLAEHSIHSTMLLYQ